MSAAHRTAARAHQRAAAPETHAPVYQDGTTRPLCKAKGANHFTRGEPSCRACRNHPARPIDSRPKVRP